MTDINILSLSLCPIIDAPDLFDFLHHDLGYSKSLIKKYSDFKNKNYLVKEKQILNIPINIVNNLFINPQYHGPNIDIIFENNDLVVINKPCKIHNHPLNYLEKNNCLSFLRQNNIFSPLQVNPTHYDRGLIHRLDYETSGVLILAKNEATYNFYRKDFNNLMAEKYYLTIVAGSFKSCKNLTLYYKKSNIKGKKIAVSKLQSSIDDQLGTSDFTLIKYDQQKDISLVKVLIKTGVRHQIRSTLAFLNHPIVGDTLYGGREEKRLMLHSYIYKIQLLNKQILHLESKVPELFNSFIDFNSGL